VKGKKGKGRGGLESRGRVSTDFCIHTTVISAVHPGAKWVKKKRSLALHLKVKKGPTPVGWSSHIP